MVLSNFFRVPRDIFENRLQSVSGVGWSPHVITILWKENAKQADVAHPIEIILLTVLGAIYLIKEGFLLNLFLARRHFSQTRRLFSQVFPKYMHTFHHHIAFLTPRREKHQLKVRFSSLPGTFNMSIKHMRSFSRQERKFFMFSRLST